MEKDHLSIKGGIHVYIAMQNVILTFSSLLNHPPLKTYNVKHTIFIRNRYLLLIRNTLKKFCSLILKDISHYHQREKSLLLNKMIQSQSCIKLKTAREIQPRDCEKATFNQVQTAKTFVTLSNVIDAECSMFILFCYW